MSTTDLSTMALTSPQDFKDNYLSGWKLFRATLALNYANLVAFVDLVGISTILPAAAFHFHGSGTVEWATTAQLIGATVGQCLLGYLSDVWSRRAMLLVALVLQGTTSLGCGLSSYISSKQPLIFPVIRALAGVALGSISNLVNVAQNDFSPEKRRLKLQGVQGASVAFGSIAGLVGGAWAAGRRWQFFYYAETVLAVTAVLAVGLCVPANAPASKSDEARKAWRHIDIAGILTGTGAVVCGLAVLCKSATLPSSTTTVLVVSFVVFAAGFVALGWEDRPTVRPIVPFHLFRNKTIAAIFAQNLLFGATYYIFIYSLPLTLQVVRQYDAIQASLRLVPYFVVHGVWSTVSAQIILKLRQSGRRSYSYMFFFGFGFWSLAMALLAFDSIKRFGCLVVFLGMGVGLGTGSVFQNSVLAITSQVESADKAVTLGTRNVLRYLGGAIGTAVSSLIIRLVMKARLSGHLLDKADSAVFDTHLSGLKPHAQQVVREAYAHAIAGVFGAAAVMIFGCVALCLCIGDDVTKAGSSDAERGGEQTPTDSNRTSFDDGSGRGEKTPARERSFELSLHETERRLGS